MPQLEVFFDYACPYCLRAHRYLEGLVPHYPDLEIVWRPCEAHPRPDPYGPHSDLCIQGMFYALDQGVDLWEYHRLMYRAALEERVTIEDPAALARYGARLLDEGGFLQALKKGSYRDRQLQSNRYAFEQAGVCVVPAYRAAGRRLDCQEDVGVSKGDLERFLQGFLTVNP